MNDGPTMTLSFTGGDRLAIKTLADRETGGNASAAIRLVVRQALAQSTTYGERYEALMRGEYRALRRMLSQAELLVIVNAVRGWMVTPHDITLLWSEVEDYLATAEARLLPPVDGPALVAKLRDLPAAACHALVYALEDAQRLAAATGGTVPWDQILGGPLRGPGEN